ncbi:hypothetical protein ACFU5D_16610 [Streptomyces anthocyanicus]|uniref:hypothetical protein n=1 Tax=Streptomyces anthocyanicus TaxID=68174 RepID=UPI00367988B8
MSGSGPKYLGITGTDGDGLKVLVWDDPEGELAKIQARIDVGETFTSVTVASHEVTLDFPVTSCELLPLQPTVVQGTLSPEQDGRYTFTTEK